MALLIRQLYAFSELSVFHNSKIYLQGNTLGFFEKILVWGKTDKDIIEHGEEQVRGWCEERGGQYPNAEYEQDGYLFALERNKITIRRAGAYREYDKVTDILGDMMGMPQPPSEALQHYPVITINTTSKPLIFGIVAGHVELFKYIIEARVSKAEQEIRE